MLLLLLAQGALDGYRDYDSYREEVRKLGTLDVVAMSSLGKTLGGREVFVLTIGTGKVHEKPAILVVGNVHAPHLAGAELALRVARLLAEKGGALLEHATFYVIPCPTPDASQSRNRERAGNDRRTDDDRDGEIGEDPPDDLDRNGSITMLRIEDETGTHMAHPDDPRILIEADPKKNEKPRWTLHVEGRDDDGDRRWNEDGSDGVDFNRNWTYRYPYFGRGAGPHQVSEVETRAVADFAFAHPNIAAVFTFTPEDNLWTLWKAEGDGGPLKGGDVPYVQLVSERYREIHGGKDAPPSPTGAGSFSEWAYAHFGRWSFAARAWWVPREGDAPKEGRNADLVQALRWFEKEKIDAFVPWTAIEVDGKKAEVGGFKPFVLLNPPARELDPLAERHFAFLSKLVELRPQIRVQDVQVEDLGEGVHRITATVANVGYLPTMSEMGKSTGKPYPLQVKLDLAKGSLVTGTTRTRLDPLAGSAKSERSWLVTGAKGKATVTVWSPSVGSDSKGVEIR
jgi:hypothetical protein